VNPADGSPSGDHRVLEPPGVTTAAARRVDALGELWDGEVRLELEALVLEPDDLARWQARLGADGTVLAAALVETIAERGALDGEAGQGTYVGRVAAVGRSHPWPATPGERVALPLPAHAVPAFAIPGPWDGRTPVVPVRGHAIAPAGVPTVLVPEDASATAARWLARLADVPAAVDVFGDHPAAGRTLGELPAPDHTPGGDAAAGEVAATARTGALVVLGGDTEPGAIALAHLAATGAAVVAVVETLQGARIADRLGARHVVIADLADVPGSADVITEETGPSGGAVLAAPHAAALAVRLAHRVLVVHDLPGGGSVAEQATAAARAVDVLVHREPGAGRGSRLRDLVASSSALAEVLRWHTGHPVPRLAGRELPPWERP
jgi:L-erythro-3,5-diaminohexanoate dehydrogenase